MYSTIQKKNWSFSMHLREKKINMIKSQKKKNNHNKYRWKGWDVKNQDFHVLLEGAKTEEMSLDTT